MWIESWFSVLRVLASGAVIYALLILLLRTSGKRTLSKLNAFDLVVTVAVGSTLSAALLSKDVPIAEGLAGLAILVVGQYAVARLSCASRWFARMVRSEPRLLLRDGEVLSAALDAERITRAELMAAVRQAGFGRVSEVGAVVLETDGSLSVIAASHAELSTLDGVLGHDARKKHATAAPAGRSVETS